MQDKIQIANILLTRRCNMSCGYCNIVKNYSDKPVEYPSMEYYIKNELTWNHWIYIFEKLIKNNPDVFFILYGGEPTLYNDIIPLLKEMHNQKMNYTIISNNCKSSQEKIKFIHDKLGEPFYGFTSSVDPIIFNDNHSDSHRLQKSKTGFDKLVEMKKQKIAKDVVAEITCDSENILYLYDTVKLLSENGIYSSITAIDDKKSPYYDFSNITDTNLLLQQNDIVDQQFDKIFHDNNLLVHIPDLLNNLYDALPSNMICCIDSNLHNVTIDSDGTFRLCLRIKGIEIPKGKIDSMISDCGVLNDDFLNRIMKDYDSLCKRCNWTCMLMSSYFSSSILKH